jgi:TPR repeat protein
MNSLPEIQAAYKASMHGDDQTALRIFRQLADQGNPEAQWQIGMRYEKGQGVTKDQVAAREWYLKAAVQGYATAQSFLGYQYERGRLYAEAIEWYRKATELGDQEAPYNLGEMYEEGRGVKQDYEEALKWFYKSADHGFPEAFVKISQWHESGKHLKQNYVQAYVWLAVSHTQDVRFQADTISALEAKMTPDQFVEAKRLVDEWKSVPATLPPGK